MSKKRAIKGWLLSLVSLLLLGCSETPQGRSALTLVPESMMVEMGESAFAQMRASGQVVRDTATIARVQCISREVIAAARALYPQVEMPSSWQVVVLNDPSPNAFALPGGHIGVHTGMLELAETSDQLAAVIGHEVAHVLADHGNERLTQQLGIKAVLVVIGLFSEGDVASGTLMQALGLGAQLGITLPFSRTHEEEADIMGQAMMAEAGFDPSQSVALWRRMAAAGNGQPLEFLSTHPAHETRIEALSANMAEAMSRYRAADAPHCGR
ncbi:M48 family metalloprotease [Halomonas alkaliantarctica]|nr:M48 family metalloprotease [Halomonas alkaliantarctica]